MNITIIIPTYNEQGSIGALLDAVCLECDRIVQHTFSILVVDGHSQDGTIETIQGRMNKDHRISMIFEVGKEGLGSAYVYGMRYAVEVLKADAFMEFDGDFQHDPKDIPRLIEALDAGNDYVIGSRYVSGGSVPREWGWYRKVLSRLGSIITRVLLNLPTHDNTSGFKLTRVHGFVDVFSLDPRHLISRRHAYKIQLLYEIIQRGARVIEVPIHFLHREKGYSKSTKEDIRESLRVIFALRRLPPVAETNI